MSTLHWEDTAAEIHKVVVGPMDNNVFVLRCKETGDALLIDAANEHDRLLELCQRLGVRTVIETHGHWDHIQAVPELRDAGYSVHVTAEDAAMLPAYDEILEDESVIEVGRLRLHTIHSPGHTSFEGGDFDTIISSLDQRLFTLPPDTLVLPGHGDDTTIGTERPHLQEWIDRGW